MLFSLLFLSRSSANTLAELISLASLLFSFNFFTSVFTVSMSIFTLSTSSMLLSSFPSIAVTFLFNSCTLTLNFSANDWHDLHDQCIPPYLAALSRILKHSSGISWHTMCTQRVQREHCTALSVFLTCLLQIKHGKSFFLSGIL